MTGDHIPDDEAPYRRFGRERGRTAGVVVVETVEAMVGLLTDAGADWDPIRRKFEARLEGAPARYRAEFEGMADAVSVSREHLGVFAFALSKVTDALGGTGTPDRGEGCTNVVIPASRAAGGPLVLKNRDISARGLRPQRLLEYPGPGDLHGFLSVTTAGTPLVYQGVNDAGLVAANTYVNVDTDVDWAEEILNGIVVRRVLEECADVAAAREFLADLPVERVTGLTLSLADGEEAALLELDPTDPAVRPTSSGSLATVEPRTNHFLEAPETEYGSSTARLDRARERCEAFPESVGVAELFDVATDHHGGPGPNSICRHAGEGADPFRLDDSTTVSAAVYRGGEATCHAVVGHPCGSEPVRHEFGADHDEAWIRGDRWRGLVGVPARSGAAGE